MAVGLFFVMTQLLAQNRTVTGTVTDATGNPLSGVTITVTGTSTRAITGQEGRFSIAVASSVCLLSITFVGYATQTFSLFCS